jgi:hypothetical protein
LELMASARKLVLLSSDMRIIQKVAVTRSGELGKVFFLGNNLK